MKLKIFLLLIIFSVGISAQDFLNGKINELNNGKEIPLVGANIHWLGTTVGTTSDDNGSFRIKRVDETDKLIVSFIGYNSDTISVGSQNNIIVNLTLEEFQTEEVYVVGETASTIADFSSIENKSIITSKELKKAACCTLAESFETNASVDATFTDAITGSRQIEMLGLSGIYTQTTTESLPYLRGLTASQGLNYIPGPWIDAINVSKGIGSVVNGFESVTGMIDIDLKEPFAEDTPLHLNFYGDSDQRIEGNMNYRFRLNESISSVALLHASSRQNKFDMNSDNFIDMPKFSVLNYLQRIKYQSENGFETQLGVQVVKDKKIGGTYNNNSYNFSTDSDQLYLFGKMGYIFESDHSNSIGLQWSFNRFNSSANFGNRNYQGKEKTLYLNLIYQTEILDHYHTLKTGASFVLNELDETFINSDYWRSEKIPGLFAEYNFLPNEILSVNAGIRTDYHNFYGTMITPRFHVRYAPNIDWVFRLTSGRGYRTSNIFADYYSSFASSRNIEIIKNHNFGYGLNQESAWNYGVSLTHYFMFNYRESSITVDFYRTDFENLVIADFDSNPQKIVFQSVANGSYSNSFQAELNTKPFENFDFRLAYRFLDVKQKINNSWVEKPFTSNHRFLLNLSYETDSYNEDDPKMVYDLTINWFNKKRIPNTSANPAEYRMAETSPAFAVVNAQITRSFFANFDIYLGVENLFDFRQTDLIIDPQNPNGNYFDASLIWGPVNGRMVYLGMRYDL